MPSSEILTGQSPHKISGDGFNWLINKFLTCVNDQIHLMSKFYYWGWKNRILCSKWPLV